MDTMKSLGGRATAVTAAIGTLFTMGFILAGPASATTDPVETAFNDMEGKVTTYGAAIVSLVIVGALIFLGVKYLRKGVSKA